MPILNERIKLMKYLKIENNKGYYRLDTSQDIWTDLDQINKEHLLDLLKIASSGEFEMGWELKEGMGSERILFPDSDSCVFLLTVSVALGK